MKRFLAMALTGVMTFSVNVSVFAQDETIVEKQQKTVLMKRH